MSTWKHNTDGNLVRESDGQVFKPHVHYQLDGMVPIPEGDGAAHLTDEGDDIIAAAEYPTYFEAKKAGKNVALSYASSVDLDVGMIETRLMDLPHRKIFPIKKTKTPQAKFHRYTVRAHRAGAAIVAPGTVVPTDSTGRTTTSVKILKLACGGNLPREFLDAEELKAELKDCRRQVDELEGQICYEGSTLPAINGLQAAAGNTEAAVATWDGAPGTSKPLTDIQDAIILGMVDGFKGPWVFVSDPTNWGEGQHRLENAGDGGLTYAIKNGIVADAFPDPSCPHGNPFLVMVSPDILCLGMAEDMVVIIGNMDTLKQTIPYTAHTRMVPIVKQANGVLEITGA
jgi:hypothetical protein